MRDDKEPSREQRIAEAAYYRAEKRGFVPGFALEDWLFGESLVDFERQRAPQDADAPSS